MDSSSTGGGTAPDWDAILEDTQSRSVSPRLSPGKRPWMEDDMDVTEFGGFPLDDEVDVVECEDCNKPVLREAYGYHRANCEMARAIAEGRLSPSILQDEVGDGVATGGADGGAEAEDDTRKSEASGSTPRGIKVKPVAAQAADGKGKLDMRKKGLGGKKHRGPVDLDRQCGVINDKGLPCSRSLTCKSHSMGAKRNVPGRSQPYDKLLFEWQKATNPAFVARLEEKERAIAAAKAASSASKERKRKSASTGERGGGRGADGSVDGAGAGAGAGARADESSTDLYATGATFQEVDDQLLAALQTIQQSANSDRTTVLPLATRGYAGQFTLRTKRYRALRHFLAQGLSGTAHVRAHSGQSIEASEGGS